MKLNKIKPKKVQLVTMLQKGFVLHQQNKLQEAKVIYEQVLAIEPNDFNALQFLGLLYAQTNEFLKAVKFLSKAIQINPNNVDCWSNYGNVLQELKRFDEAIACYDKALRIKKDAFIYYNRGSALKELKRFDDALASYTQAININPDADIYNNLGYVLQVLHRLEEALVSYDQAISIKPDHAEAYFNRGSVLQELKRFDESLAGYEQAIGIKPDYAAAYTNLGNVLKELKRFDESLSSYEQAISIKPDYAEAYFNRGVVLQELNRLEGALASYDKAINIRPDYADAYFNRGNALKELKFLKKALVSYEQAISIKSDYVEAYNNSGVVLQELKHFEEALVIYDQVIGIKPDYADAYFNSGVVLQEFKRYDEVTAFFNKALNIKPNYKLLIGQLQHVKMVMCDWENFENQRNLILQKIDAKEIVIAPFPILAIVDDPKLHRKVSESYVAENHPYTPVLDAAIEKSPNKKIRLGYYSADFRNHPVSFLTAELFEIHDKDRFEIVAFSFGPDLKDEMHNRLSKAFDQFIDVRDKSDQDVAMLSRGLEIDIAIDLGGYTKDCRPGIFSYRAAPMQLSYIGYLGTSGAPYIDYLIADKTIVPVDSQNYYSEKIVYLPSYQVNDRKRKISSRQFSRKDFGLPMKSFIFCSFNNNYKILPTTFNGWMKILLAVDNSMLFFYAENKWARSNLINEALKRGISSERLVFGEHLEPDEYLARYKLCDLFLDTYPYNAGTTASDALWAGLPVLTMMGESFASRMAASLLTAIDLPELITNSQEQYEAQAIELATNPAKLKALKVKLETNRLTTPLFDTPRFTKHLEDAYTKMYEHYHADLAPEHIYIEEDPS
jgi:predicted O-linked N-acetylglucosamine transferase (SPINDLY family)